MCTNIKNKKEKKKKKKKKEKIKKERNKETKIINNVSLLLGRIIKEFVLKILLEQCCKLVIAFIKKGIE